MLSNEAGRVAPLAPTFVALPVVTVAVWPPAPPPDELQLIVRVPKRIWVPALNVTEDAEPVQAPFEYVPLPAETLRSDADPLLKLPNVIPEILPVEAAMVIVWPEYTRMSLFVVSI